MLLQMRMSAEISHVTGWHIVVTLMARIPVRVFRDFKEMDTNAPVKRNLVNSLF